MGEHLENSTELWDTKEYLPLNVVMKHFIGSLRVLGVYEWRVKTFSGKFSKEYREYLEANLGPLVCDYGHINVDTCIGNYFDIYDKLLTLGESECAGDCQLQCGARCEPCSRAVAKELAEHAFDGTTVGEFAEKCALRAPDYVKVSRAIEWLSCTNKSQHANELAIENYMAIKDFVKMHA